MNEIEFGEFAALGAVDFDLRFLGTERLAAINDSRHQIYLLLKSILVLGITEGAFDPKTDASFAANSILFLMNATPKWHRSSGARSVRQVGDWYKRFILAGLRNPPTGWNESKFDAD